MFLEGLEGFGGFGGWVWKVLEGLEGLANGSFEGCLKGFAEGLGPGRCLLGKWPWPWKVPAGQGVWRVWRVLESVSEGFGAFWSGRLRAGKRQL